MDRRQLLKATAAAVLAPAIPSLSVAAAAIPAPAPAIPAWVVGTPGEFDWQHIVAETAQDAWHIWREDHGREYHPEELPDEHHIQRVPAWDGRQNVCGADWLRAGLGYTCDRCGNETGADDGEPVESEVVCEDCLTFADRVKLNRGDAVDRLTDDIISDGEASMRASLERSKQWPVPDGVWEEACGLAAAWDAEEAARLRATTPIDPTAEPMGVQGEARS